MITAVVGHVEWVTFAEVARLPAPGEIVHARTLSDAAAGGGAVAAVQLARLGGTACFFTSLGDDPLGRLAAADLRARGVELHAATAGVPQRRALTHLTDDHERTITVLGERHVARGDDPLPWDRLAEAAAVYVTGGDEAALRHARRARVVVATPRTGPALAASGVELDVLVASANDPGEQVDPARWPAPPRVVVRTDGARGGTWSAADGSSGRWTPVPPPGPPVDAYGCGDAFAAGLTHGLGSGLRLPDAIALGARCGATVLTGRGPYAAMLASD